MDSIPRAAVAPLIRSALYGYRNRAPADLVVLGATVMNGAEREELTESLRNPDPAQPSEATRTLAERVDALLPPRERLPDGLVLSPEEAVTLLEAAITGAFAAGERPAVIEQVIGRLESQMDRGARGRLAGLIDSGLTLTGGGIAEAVSGDWQRVLVLLGRPATRSAPPVRAKGLRSVLRARR